MRTLSLILALIAAACSESRTIGALAPDAVGSDDLGLDRADASVPASWAVSIGSVELGAIAVDAAGNSYVTGYSIDDRILDGGVGPGPPQADPILFVNKLDRGGRPVWAWSTWAAGQRGPGIAVDTAGNVYITGELRGKVDFGANTLTSTSDVDAFVAKLDSSGKGLWAVSAGSTGIDGEHGIAVDAKGDVYLTGEFKGEVSFGATTLTSKGHADAFVAKLDSAGNWQWAVSVGGVGRDEGHGIALDTKGDVHLTGQFEGEVSFGATTLDASLEFFGDFQNVFVAKLDSTGKWLWTASPGGVGHTACGYGIAVDGAANSYITGSFAGEVTIGADVLKSTEQMYPDPFVAKLDETGRWLWGIATGDTKGLDERIAVDVDGDGNSHVIGSFSETTSFGSTTLSSKGDTDLFVARLDSSGRWVWAMSAGSVDGDRGADIAVDAAGNSYRIGELGGQATLGSTPLPAGGFVRRVAKEGL